MTFRDDIYSITTGDATVSGLVGSRVYPNRRPVDVTEPSVVYHAFISDNNSAYRTQDGAGRTETRVSFECWAESSREASALADAIEGLWNGYRDIANYDIGRSFKANRLSDGYHQEIKLYRVVVDFLVEHGEPT